MMISEQEMYVKDPAAIEVTMISTRIEVWSKNTPTQIPKGVMNEKHKTKMIPKFFIFVSSDFI